MSTLHKGSPHDQEKSIPDCSAMKFGIVVSEWNSEITDLLLEGCKETLLKHGADKDKIVVAKVPGSFELVGGAGLLAESEGVDAVVCIGCIIKGETKHDEYISNAVANGLVQLNISYRLPFIFGVLTTNNVEQASDRAGGKHGNKGSEAAVAAIKMAALHSGFNPK